MCLESVMLVKSLISADVSLVLSSCNKALVSEGCFNMCGIFFLFLIFLLCYFIQIWWGVLTSESTEGSTEGLQQSCLPNRNLKRAKLASVSGPTPLLLLTSYFCLLSSPYLSISLLQTYPSFLLSSLPSPCSQIMVLTDPEFESSVLISTDEGASYQKYRLSFFVLSLLFHPTEEDWALAYSHDQKVRSLQFKSSVHIQHYCRPLHSEKYTWVWLKEVKLMPTACNFSLRKHFIIYLCRKLHVHFELWKKNE